MTIKQALKACEKHAPNESIIITHQLQRCVHHEISDAVLIIEQFRISTGFKLPGNEIRCYTSNRSLADCVEQFLTTEK